MRPALERPAFPPRLAVVGTAALMAALSVPVMAPGAAALLALASVVSLPCWRRRQRSLP